MDQGQATAAAPRVGCGAAIIRDGRILLLLRRKPPEAGAWGLPGGKVELYEPAAAAVARELAEELGITVEPDVLLCVADHIDAAERLHWLAPIYLVTRYEGEPRLMEPEKHADLQWMALDRLPQSLTVPTRAALAAWHRRIEAFTNQPAAPR